jgi:hypothetical protein
MNKKEIIKQGVDLFNKHFPNDKHTTEKDKTALIKFFIDLHKVTNSNSNLANKTIKVLQSKVKTYEQDINKGIYVYKDNCYCVKCKQQRLEANRKELRSANDLKGTTKLF